MIHQAEEIDAKQRKWENERKSIEGKFREYQFILNQKSQQLKEKVSRFAISLTILSSCSNAMLQEIQAEKLGHQLELLVARKSSYRSAQGSIQWNATVKKVRESLSEELHLINHTHTIGRVWSWTEC